MAEKAARESKLLGKNPFGNKSQMLLRHEPSVLHLPHGMMNSASTNSLASLLPEIKVIKAPPTNTLDANPQINLNK